MAFESHRAMNYAYVRIEGRVPDFPSVNDGSLSFRVLDDSGDMRVTAYRTVAEALTHSQRIPMPGDHVTVEGTLRIRDDEPSLVLNAPEAMAIQSAETQDVRLAALDTFQVGERVRVVGQVRRIRDISDSFKLVTLRNGSATVDVVLPLNLPAFAHVPKMAEGDWLRVTGGVGEFRGAKQLLPSDGSAIEHAQRPDDDQLRPIAALDKNFIGQWVSVLGRVDDLRPFSQGMRIVLSDADQGGQGGQNITIVAFDRVWQSLPFSQTVSVGDAVRVEGELQDYRDALEIVPELPVDVDMEKR